MSNQPGTAAADRLSAVLNMGSMASKKLTLEEQMKQNKRMIDRAVRELDREKRKLEQQQHQVEMDIKKAAKENQMGSVRIMAKDLIRTKRYVEKFYQMRTQLQAVGLRMQTMKSTEAMSRAMKGACSAMTRMNHALNLPALQRIMQQFAVESERMDMTEEVMEDAVDGVMDADGDEEDEEKVVSQVLDELGITRAGELPDAPGAVPAVAAAAPVMPEAPRAVAGGPVSDLEARLNNLRK